MKKLPHTPNSQIRSALRKLSLRSRERAAVLKRDNYSCVKCNAKQSKAKGKEVRVECHHKDGITNWAELYKAIRKFLLCNPDKMETLCEECHEKTKQVKRVGERV